MCRDENRSKLGVHEVDAQGGGDAGGRAGQGVQEVQVRLGPILGVRGDGVHDHHIPSGWHVQNGTGRRRGGCRGPEAESARRGRSQGGGRVHHAHDRPGQHERADHNDRGKGVGHDQEKMARQFGGISHIDQHLVKM